MNYLLRLIDIINDTMYLIDRSIAIESITTTGSSHELNVCDVKYAQEGRNVTIDGIAYEITEVRADDRVIVVEGATPITVTWFELYQVYFFHGTPVEVNQETTQEGHAHDYTPMIWLNEIFEENPNYDDALVIENEVTPMIFALGERPNDKLSKDLHEKYLQPMRRLMELFIDAIKKRTAVFEAREFNPRLTNYAKFGVYFSNKGVSTSLFSSLFSGVEMSADLLIISPSECRGCNKKSVILASEDDEVLLSEDNETLIPE